MSTPDYIRRSQNNYNAKFDIIQIKAPKGTKERITAVSGQSMAAFCLQCVLDRLDELESTETTEEPTNTPIDSEEATPAQDWEKLMEYYNQRKQENEARKKAAANEMPPEPEQVQDEEPEQIGFTAAKILEIIQGGGSLPEDPEKETVRAASINRADAEN